MVLSACEVEFDFSGLDSDPLFLIDGHIKTNQSGYEHGAGNLQMYLYAVPSAAGERDFSEDARCTLKVYRNSELIGINEHITIQSFYGLIADSYKGISPGDEITVTAESEGFPTASAKVVIPHCPPAVEAHYSMDGSDLKIRFSFEDNADTDDAYALCFRRSNSGSSNPPDESEIGSSLELAFGSSLESAIMDIGPFDVTWEDGERYYGLFDDSFNGSRKEFEVTVPAIRESAYEGTAYFRIEIQRISTERLRYEIACRDKGSNALGFIGLAPVTFAYTNVAGGSGCFSCGNTGYSPWTAASE